MFVPFPHANAVGDRFLELLHKHGIEPPTGSAVEDELLSPTHLLEIFKKPALAAGVNEEKVLRNAAGIYDLAAKVLTVEPLQEFEQFVPHLKLITKAKVRVASLGQNASSEYDDDTARKIAELYVGCLVAHLGTQVSLDHPENSKGDNPDVMFTLTDANGETQRWALAIKSISTLSGQTIFERIADGVRQIEDPKCQADRGLVVINAKSAIDHQALWSRDFKDLREAQSGLAAELIKIIAAASKDRSQGEWDQLFTGKTVRPIIFMAQTIVRLPTPVGILPTPMGMMLSDGAWGPIDSDGEFIAHQMNVFMQTIRLGEPGSIGQMPR
ncbi:hypothetical protein ACVIGB_008965 [Bradyrhizobium sp. USDA 4341]